MINKKLTGVLIVIVIVAMVFVIVVMKAAPGTNSNPGGNSGLINIVAAENFYGNIASQLGGDKVHVTSILSDPNVDPHEYESNVEDGIAITNADIVIENGLEYDAWIDKLLSASPNPARILLTAGSIAPDALADNPHVWYGIDNIAAIANAITDALKKTDPADSIIFDNNLMNFVDSLTAIQGKMGEIKAKYAGTPVGLTETIYLYETQPTGLQVLTPFGFEKAIAEGNDPSAADVKTTDDQVNNKQIKVLIYNSQTVTPITSNLQAAAQANGIPIVAVSETMPPNMNYQAWITGQLNALEQALAQATGK